MVCSTRGRHFFKDPLEENTQRAMFEQFSTRQVAISFCFADWLRESREFSGPIIERRKKTNPIPDYISHSIEKYES